MANQQATNVGAEVQKVVNENPQGGGMELGNWIQGANDGETEGIKIQKSKQKKKPKIKIRGMKR